MFCTAVASGRRPGSRWEKRKPLKEQVFIERIDIFPERREDGNWIRNIKFQFPVPVLRDGKEVVRVDSISLDKEQSGEHTVTLEKFPTLETVVLLSQLK